MAAIASLAMYDWPALRVAQEAFYAAWRDAMSARGLCPPPKLSWHLPLSDVWPKDDLFVAQTCGLPFAGGQCGEAQLIATPCYELPRCVGAHYRSVLVAASHRESQDLASFRGGVLAMNQPDSYSGQRALFAHIDSLGLARGAEPFFESTRATGSHLASMQAVASGEADLAAIDCVLWAHAAEFQRELRDSLCVIDQTRLAPGLPFITSGSRSADELALMQEALGEVIGRPSQSDYQPLRLSGFEILPPSAYDLS